MRLTVLLIVFLIAFQVQSYNLSKNTGFGLNLGMYRPEGVASNVIEEFSDHQNIIGGHLRYFFERSFGLELKYSTWNHRKDNLPTFQLNGRNFPGSFKFDIQPIEFNVLYYFKTDDDRVMPYVKGGFSYYWVEYDYFPDILSLASDISFRKSDETYGYNVAIGLDYFPTAEFSIGGEILYRDAEVKLDLDDSPFSARERTDLTGYQFGIVFTYFFSPGLREVF